MLTLPDDPVLEVRASDLAYEGNMVVLETLRGPGTDFNFITVLSGTSTSISGTVEVLKITGDGTVCCAAVLRVPLVLCPMYRA